MKHIQNIQTLIACIILCIFFSESVHAEGNFTEKENLEIIFVIDCSGSMQSNDPAKVGLNMVQAFIDTAQSEKVKIGYVAYNDEIIASSLPESIETEEGREKLKSEIASVPYYGNTDIALGLSYAYEMMHTEKESHKVIVLISDGETYLPEQAKRTVEQSNQELLQDVNRCKEGEIPIYTIAFGKYDGNEEFLKEIAEATNAEYYSAQNPEMLIDVLYGIFQDNMFCKIQHFSSGTYAGGSQEITCVLDNYYLSELNVLLLSSQDVGNTVVRYGEQDFLLNNLSHYAVGKFKGDELTPSFRQMVLHTDTEDAQDLHVYVISYRDLTTKLELLTEARKNQELEYEILFQDREGKNITDTGFYETLSWKLACVDTSTGGDTEIGACEITDGILKGSLYFAKSGTYSLSGSISDDFGEYVVSATIEVPNETPTGSIPQRTIRLSKNNNISLCLDDYFQDADGDHLSYAISDGQSEGITALLEGNMLTITPQRTGEHYVLLQVDDGEDVINYAYYLEVTSFWQEYWWLALPVLAALVFIIWKFTHKPKSELEILTIEKKNYNFCGKMNAYFLQQPENEEEIPPLSFQMNRIRESQVTLGTLFSNYPIQAEALKLDCIYLIADEKQNMILYHTSEAGVMVGNSIVCKNIRYSIGFGDVIYITSPDARYDLEIHYIAVYE